MLLFQWCQKARTLKITSKIEVASEETVLSSHCFLGSTCCRLSLRCVDTLTLKHSVVFTHL